MEVSNHIPDDIAFSILSKLSLKSLKRFECVNKSWSLLFDNPYFMTMFRNNLLTKDHPYYEDTYVLVQTTPNDCATIYKDYKFFLHSLSGESCEKVVQLDWPKPFQNYDPPNQENHTTCFTILGSVSINGILCLQYIHYGEIQLVLWNPTTKEFKSIPSSPIESKRHWCAFPHNNRVRVGYNRVAHDYKLIRFISCHSRDLPTVSFWEMYSLNSNTWRTIDVDMHNSYDDVDVYNDGVCHWWSKRDEHTCLVSFDFNNESFITTLIPSHWDT